MRSAQKSTFVSVPAQFLTASMANFCLRSSNSSCFFLDTYVAGGGSAVVKVMLQAKRRPRARKHTWSIQRARRMAPVPPPKLRHNARTGRLHTCPRSQRPGHRSPTRPPSHHSRRTSVTGPTGDQHLRVATLEPAAACGERGGQGAITSWCIVWGGRGGEQEKDEGASPVGRGQTHPPLPCPACAPR